MAAELSEAIALTGRCETCRYWTNGDGSSWGAAHAQAEKMGIKECCRATEFWYALTWDERPDGEHENVLKPEYADRKHFTQDGSDYRSHLFTKAEFGCVEYRSQDGS